MGRNSVGVGKRQHWLAATTATGLMAVAACGATGGEGSQAAAEGDPETYYEGRTIEITVPFGPGGGSDNSARMLGDFLAEYIPGNPDVQVVNVEGGGSVLGANEYAIQAPDDGTALLITSTSTVLPWILGQEAVEYDLADLQLLWGHPAGRTIYAAEETGVETIEDVQDSSERLIAGGRGPTGADLELLVGLEVLEIRDQIEMIFGYEGGGAQALAFEQGETNINHQPTGSLIAEDWHLIEEGANVVYTHGLIEGDTFVPDPALPEAPTILDAYVELYGEQPSGEAWEAFKTLEGVIQTAKYGLWVKGDAPPAATEALEAGLEAMVDDPEYTPQAHALLGPYDPVRGEDLVAYRELLQNINPDHLSWLRDFVATEYDVEGLGD